MKYQLVVQFQASSPDDFDELIAFEESLQDRMGESALVDGHDFGSGEHNIFVLTDHPATSFEHVQEVAQKIHPKQRMRVAYRGVTADEFHILWPPNLREFKIA
jgi:hypothetical protein